MLGGWTLVHVEDHNILLCEREQPVEDVSQAYQRVHHAFTVSPETLVQVCKVFHERQIPTPISFIALRVYSQAGNCISSIPAGTDLNSATRLGRKGCPNLPSRKSCARKHC